MSIATKNGSVILKSGSVAQSCVCCGDKWYCCPEPTCASDTVSSVTVTIAPRSSLWIAKRREREYCSNVHYYQVTRAVDCSAVSGTHSLVKANPTTWTKTLPADSVGCSQPVVTLEFQSYSFFGTPYTRWVLSVENPSYAHWRWTATGTAQFKELSDMQCTNSTISSDADKCTDEISGYSFGKGVGISRTQMYNCSPQTALGGLPFVGALSAIAPTKSSDEKGPPPDPNDFSSITGSLECDVTVVIA